jgi:hypothetical protein
MVEPWPHRPFTFRALSKTYGQMWLRCDVCRRYARLSLAGLHDVDYRTKSFSCSRCGFEAYFCLVEPITEYGRPTIGSTKWRNRSVIRTPSSASPNHHGARYRAGAVNCPAASPMDGASPIARKVAAYGAFLELLAELGARSVSLASRLTVPA